jgi:hypothetical protein
MRQRKKTEKTTKQRSKERGQKTEKVKTREEEK